MVDPNRKINRLSETDISFLDVCEEKFENRFSDSDEQFISHVQKSTPDPPVIPEFEQRQYNQGGYNRNNRYNRPNHRGGGFNNRHSGGPYHRGGGFNRGRGSGGVREHNFNYRY